MVPMEPSARGMAAPVGRDARGFTMMELLVTLGILAIALASVLSIFARGSQFGLKAQERTEASRVAQAVFDVMSQGWEFPASSSTWYGRDGDGKVIDGTIRSDQIASQSDLPSSWRPAYVVRSHLTLVWEADVAPYTQDGIAVHMLTITVCFDDDGDRAYDASRDRRVGKYYAILADRKVSP